MKLLGGYLEPKEIALVLSKNLSAEIFGPREVQIASFRERLIWRIEYRVVRFREWIALKIAPWLRVEDDF